jgi:hypothetical protein
MIPPKSADFEPATTDDVFKQLQASLAAVPSPDPHPGDTPREREQRLRRWMKGRRTALARAVASLGGPGAAEPAPAALDKPKDPSTRRNVIRPPRPWTPGTPAFEIARDGGFFGMDRLHPTELVHVLAIGGTGVGKTHSCVLPLMRNMLRHELPTQDGLKRAALFIVDPKKELLPEVVECLRSLGTPKRLLHLGVGRSLPPVRFFEPDDGLTNREKLARLHAVLRTEELAEGHHAYWHRAGLELVEQFMELELAYWRKTRTRLLKELARTLDLPRRGGGFWAVLEDVFGYCLARGENFAHATAALESLLKLRIYP